MEEIYQFRRSEAQKKRHRILDHFMILNIEQGLSPSISISLEYITNVELQHSTKLTKAFLGNDDADVIDEIALVDWIIERHHYYPVLEGEHLLRVNQLINKNVDLLIDRWIENKSTSGLKLVFSHLDMDLVNLFSISMTNQNAKAQSAKALDQLNQPKSKATQIKTAQFQKVSAQKTRPRRQEQRHLPPHEDYCFDAEVASKSTPAPGHKSGRQPVRR